MKTNQDIKNTILKRLLVSIGILLLIRVGTFLPVPGINHTDLAFYLQKHSVTRNLINIFAGNNLFLIGLFSLSIFPSINASIFIQVILRFSPQLAKLQKEGDLSGRRKIIRLTRLLTLFWAIAQSLSIVLYLKKVLFNWNYFLTFEVVIWLVAGAMIVLWLSELITDYGLGNGASLLIYTNIISNLPNIWGKFTSKNFSFLSGFEISLMLLISLYGIVVLQEGARIVPLLSSKQLNQISLEESIRANNYIPLRFNQAGVMPIILTTAILIGPSYLINLGNVFNIKFPINFGYLKILYWISYFLLVLLFSAFYSSIILNPTEISEQLQKMAVIIPGIRPGVRTSFYLKQLMKRITLIGAVILASLATLPNLLESVLNTKSLNGLSVTSLLILAGVVLDLTREIKNIYYSNIYNNMY